MINRIKTWLRSKLLTPATVPEAPTWIEQQVRDFRTIYPNATIREWSTFATGLGQRAFLSGFQVGWESKAYDREPRLELVPIHQDFMSDKDLNAVVPLQGEPNYEHVVFTDERGSGYERS